MRAFASITAIETDFLVPILKINIRHWSGFALRMKNMFSVVRETRCGWPKNILHWKDIQASILDLGATVPVQFVIADGIVAMEGNGPLNGTPRLLENIVLADAPVAADAACSRLIGFELSRIVHIREGSRFLGNAAQGLIDQVGGLSGRRLGRSLYRAVTTQTKSFWVLFTILSFGAFWLPIGWGVVETLVAFGVSWWVIYRMGLF